MAELRFAADRMLGRLARWLRILGHDTAYGPHLTGRGLVACARREGRVLLTRDTRLARRRALPPHLLLGSDDFREQLREVAAAVPLGRREIFSRCLACNRVLEDGSRAAAEAHVPPFVWRTSERFRRCGGCGRWFWPATHRQHVIEELGRVGLAPTGTEAG